MIPQKLSTSNWKHPGRFAQILFWSWNLIFLAFMLFGFGPRLLPEMLIAVQGGLIQGQFLVYAAVLAAVPVVVVLLGLFFFRRSPARLFALGYALEGPLMLMLAVRFFIIRQATPAVSLLLVLGGLGMAAFLWQLFEPQVERRGALALHLRALGLTLFLVVILYASLWLAFYVVPFTVQIGQAIGDFLRNFSLNLANLRQGIRDLLVNEWRWIPFWLLGIPLFFYTATLFVLMPVAVPWLAFRAWLRDQRQLAGRHGRSRSAGVLAAALVLFVTVFVLAVRQPQQLAFALLEEPPASAEEAESLLAKEQRIRAGLLNAYLAPMRYVSAVGEVDHISGLYEYPVGLSRSNARLVQQAYEAVAQPLLYIPAKTTDRKAWAGNRTLTQEPLEAARLYQRFFDRPIVEAEKETIVQAVRTTWSRDQAQAAWLAVDDREVHLAHQEINIQEHGDWAEVELYEVYQNQTADRQEVVYYFSLPESAVITGLWLGESADRDARYVFRVAPRGAAQAVYRNEIRLNIDPALVEQIGPRQYRLRVFPVLPMNWEFDDERDRSIVTEAPPMHLWLAYRVLASDGAWPLPRLAIKQNVYWDRASERLVNGEPMQVGEEDWLPDSISIQSPGEPLAHRFDFPDGVTVLAQPVSSAQLPAFDGSQQLAVVLDRSRTMAERAEDVKAVLDRLREVVGGEVDVYLTASPYRGEQASIARLAEIDPEAILYFGGQNPGELLAQFEALRAGRSYDAILVLTDGSGYELGPSEEKITPPDVPVWMVHLGGDFPLGYDDRTLEAIQASGGGAVSSLDEALSRLAVSAVVGLGEPGTAPGNLVDVVDGYVWSTLPTSDLEAEEVDVVSLLPGAQAEMDPEFGAFAARRWILAEMRWGRGDPARLAMLDQLHAAAAEHSVVSPFSSMIVLVNEEQHRLLDRMEERDDRFAREYEGVGETEPISPFTVTGVPEPEEWLLMALAAGLLVWYICKSRREARLWKLNAHLH
jgi:putative PEP-CTERM system integral membrane protein